MQERPNFHSPAILFGGDYNPEQWLDRPDILEQDLQFMEEAGVNAVTLGVFAWSVEEPEENSFHLEWLHSIMDRLWEKGISTILATPSGARPAWMDRGYPQVMRVARNGIRNLHGLRHNHCPSSPQFRKQVKKIDIRLAQEFGRHPGLILWHISNELGGECYCPLCRRRFQEYLKRQFHGDIEALNRAWWTTFWSHRYDSFDEIDPPMENGETSIMGLNLAWKQFTTWNMADFLSFEADILQREAPGVPVTTNFMRRYPGLDYRAMASRLSVVSWDSYPQYGREGETLFDTFADTAFDHALMRGLGHGKPFLLMENAPGLVNWHPYNRLQRPGVQKLAGFQAVACGSESVLYFQWRKSRGSFEQYHGAIVDHLGTNDTRVFRETADLGHMIASLGRVAGTKVQAQTAVLYDWNCRWALEGLAGLGKDTRRYTETVAAVYRNLMRLGAESDVIGPEEDFSRYAVLVAPMLYLLKPGLAARFTNFVRSGGTLLATYLTGYVDEHTLCWLGGFPGDGLNSLFGVVSEEIDTLYPSEKNRADFKDGCFCEIRDYAEILRVNDAETVATYGKDFYVGSPMVTRRRLENGSAWYVAARLDDRGMEHLLSLILRDTDVTLHPMPDGIEYHERIGKGKRYGFYLNTTDHEIRLHGETGRCLQTGKPVPAEGLILTPMGVSVIERMDL